MMIIPENIASRYLNRVIIDKSFIYLDNWSFIHFFSGVVIAFVLIKIEKWYKYLIAFGLMVAYEIEEYHFWDSLFIPEQNINILFDLIVGMFAFTITTISIKYFKIKSTKVKDGSGTDSK